MSGPTPRTQERKRLHIRSSDLPPDQGKNYGLRPSRKPAEGLEKRRPMIGFDPDRSGCHGDRSLRRRGTWARRKLGDGVKRERRRWLGAGGHQRPGVVRCCIFLSHHCNPTWQTTLFPLYTGWSGDSGRLDVLPMMHGQKVTKGGPASLLSSAGAPTPSNPRIHTQGPGCHPGRFTSPAPLELGLRPSPSAGREGQEGLTPGLPTGVQWDALPWPGLVKYRSFRSLQERILFNFMYLRAF